MRRPAPSMVREAGGKGANLAEMVRASIPVPPGFVVVTDTYFDFLKEAGLTGPIKEALKGLDTSKTKDLEAAAAR
ncbi:MAG: hypothetical protein FJ317_04860, partial [SAR202 cluster bacterium]|nr:hypothetical protein [SAR202 cluster bacterium]